MPKPPRSLLDYCKPEEYEYMLKRCKAHTIRDSNFSTPEIQSTTWLVYPKGESWSKESGIKRFNDLSFDISCTLGCKWEVLLHCYGLTMSYDHHLFYDGWDGLFDEDCYFSEEGFRNGFYNCYYITDVFYESKRLCKYLLNSAETEQEKTLATKTNSRKRGRKKDPKVKRRNKAIADYKAKNPRMTYKETGKVFDVSADTARKACDNPDN